MQVSLLSGPQFTLLPKEVGHPQDTFAFSQGLLSSSGTTLWVCPGESGREWEEDCAGCLLLQEVMG